MSYWEIAQNLYKEYKDLVDEIQELYKLYNPNKMKIICAKEDELTVKFWKWREAQDESDYMDMLDGIKEMM